MGFGIVACVNEVENPSLHGFGAVLGFVCANVYAYLIMGQLAAHAAEGATTYVSIRVKLIAAIGGTLSLCFFAYFSRDWHKYHGTWRGGGVRG